MVLSAFLSFFGLFATVIYPNRLFLHPNTAADLLATFLPGLFLPFISIFRVSFPV